MSIWNGNLPNRYVRRHRSQKLAQRQRNDQPEVVGPWDVHILPDTPQIEEWSTVNGYAQQLDHCDGHRIWEITQQHLSDYIITGRNDVPEEAEWHHGNHLLCESSFESHFYVFGVRRRSKSDLPISEYKKTSQLYERETPRSHITELMVRILWLIKLRHPPQTN